MTPPDSSPTSPWIPSGTPPLSPPRIADHELIRRIGQGAYGEVWLARSVTGAFRAVKIVRRSSFDHERPFEREFEGIQRFEPVSRTHDSQVDILHVGRGEDYFYYVMELADDQVTGGQINPDNYHPRTLKSDLLFHSRLSFEECVSIGIALTTALEHLHQSGLVHRDVKPSNIIFVNGVAKLADIGLVTGVDTTRSYVGTEGFAAPEGPGTPQGDLFSLGKVFYEMSTGKDRQEFPELPTNLRELPEREGLVELNAVIARACRHDPRDRYPNAAAMRADLELLQSGKSLARLRKVEQRLRSVRRAGAVVVVAAVIGLAGFWFQTAQTHKARELAVRNRQIAEENSHLASENSKRVLQLDLANGIREMDKGDFGSAMTWWADALKYTDNNRHEQEMLRFRISNLLQMHPKPLAAIPVRGGTNGIAWQISSDGRRILLTTDNVIELWTISFPPQLVTSVPDRTNWTRQVLSKDGSRFVLSSSNRPPQLWTVTAGQIQITNLSIGPMQKVRFAGNGDLAGIASNHVLTLVNLQHDHSPRELVRFEFPVEEVYVSEDGRRVAVMLTNRVVHVVDLQNGKLLRQLALSDRRVLAGLDANGRFVISALRPDVPLAMDYQPEIWDVLTGEKITSSPAHELTVYDIATSRDGRWLATASRDRTARVWKLATGDPLTEPLEHETTASAVAFSPDNGRLATADRKTARVWDIYSARPLTPPLQHSELIRNVGFAMDGAILLTASVDGFVRCWDLTSSDRVRKTLPTRTHTGLIEFSPDGKLLLVKDPLETLIWRVRDWHLTCRIPHGDTSSARCFSSDSQFIVIADGAKGARVYKAGTGEAASTALLEGTNAVSLAVFSPDGQSLATAGEHGRVVLWDWRQGRQILPTLIHTNPVASVTLSPRGNRLLTSTLDKDHSETWLWSLQEQTIVNRGGKRPRRYGWFSAGFNGNGLQCVMGAAYPAHVQVLDSETGEDIGPPLQHENTIAHANYSPDGKHILTTSLDQTVQLWDASSGKRAGPPFRHETGVVAANFSPDGRILHSIGEDTTRLWDASTGLPLTPWIVTEQNRRFPALHPSGEMVVTGTRDRRVVVTDFRLNLPVDVLKDWVKLTSSRTLSDDRSLDRLPSAETDRVRGRLHALNPESFELSQQQLAQWHEGQILDLGYLRQIEQSIFHLDCLIQLKPNDNSLRERRARLAAKLVRPRDLSAPARFIDLTDYYTGCPATLSNGDLNELPQGIHRLAGTEFDIRGQIKLNHARPDLKVVPGERPRVSHIRVTQRCRMLHFLQASEGSGLARQEVSRFIIHYADGSERIKSMVSGRDLLGWWQRNDSQNKPTEAVIAWEGHCELATRGNQVIRLYKATWINPTPDVEISHLEFQIGETLAKPFVIAITAE